MRIAAVFISAIFFFIRCKNQDFPNESAQSGTPRIEGKISGFEDDIVLRGIDTTYTIALDSTGFFSQQLSSGHIGEYTMNLGMENRIPLYIGERTDLEIKIDFDKLKYRQPESIKVIGTNVEETKLLHELFNLEPINKYTIEQYKDEYLPMVYLKTPSEFESYQLEQFEKIKEFILNYVQDHELDPKFLEHAILNSMLKFNLNFARYDGLHNNLKSHSSIQVQAPNNFEDYFSNDIPQDDWDLYQENLAYQDYITNKYYTKMAQVIGHRGAYLDYYKAKVAFLNGSDFPDRIKEVFFNGLVIDYMNLEDDDIKTYLEIMISKHVTDSISLNRFKEFKKRETAYVNGEMAPNFTYPDINGVPVSLSKFKGSVVYMDLWATWCTPCLQELPDLKRLKEKYKGQNMVFLGISFDENVDRWKKMAIENREGLFDGIQLSAGSMDNKISTDYNVNGIPHYILIDSDGSIVQKKAFRPSDPRLIELIDQLTE